MWKDIDEMPMMMFVRVVCSNDYSAMKARRCVSINKKVAMELFEEYYAEYSERLFSGDTSSLETPKKIALLTAKARILSAISLLIETGEISDSMRKIARFYGYKLKGNKNEDIKGVSAVIAETIRLLKNAISKMKSETFDRSGKYTIEYFSSIHANMSKHFKFNISMNSISVGQYCSYYVQMKEDIKELEKVNRKTNNIYGR